jgi:hypothetical protein
MVRLSDAIAIDTVVMPGEAATDDSGEFIG